MSTAAARPRRRQVGRAPLRRDRIAVRRRLAAGATFLYFGLIGLPALFFGGSMAVDFTRIIIAAREVDNATQAAALAAAYEFSSTGDPTKLDTAAARDAARDTLQKAVSTGSLHMTTLTVSDAAGASVQVSGDRTTVTVTVDYAVDDLVFMGVLRSVFGSDGGDVSGGYTQTARAFVCNPTVVTGPTQGFCVRPGGWG